MRILITRRIKRRFLKRNRGLSLRGRRMMRGTLMVSKGLTMLIGLIVRINWVKY
jgi:hypothetical protein